MNDRTLRMKAELDGAGVKKSLASMEQGLRHFYKDARNIPAPFAAAGKTVDDVGKRFNLFSKITGRLHTEVHAVGHAFKEFSPELSKAGVAMGGVVTRGGAVVGAVVAIGAVLAETTRRSKEFSEAIHEMDFTARQTGQAIVKLKELEMVGRRFGISQGEIAEGTKSFAWATQQFVTNYRGFRSQLAAQGVPHDLLAPMLRRLEVNANDTTGALDDLIVALDKIKQRYPGARGEQLSKFLAGQFGLSEKFARMTGEEMRHARGQAGRELDPAAMAKAVAGAKAFHEEWQKTLDILDRWEIKFQSTVLGPLTSALGLMNRLLGQDPIRDAGRGIGGAANSIRPETPTTTMGRYRSSLRQQSLIDAGTPFGDVGRSIMSAGDSIIIQEQQSIWREYWKKFGDVGRSIISGEMLGGGGGGGGIGVGGGAGGGASAAPRFGGMRYGAASRGYAAAVAAGGAAGGGGGGGTPAQQEAFDKMKSAASAAGSPNPELTASLAMLESGWMNSGVFKSSGGTNAFGQTGVGPKGFVTGADGQKHAVYGSLDEATQAHIAKWGKYYGGTPQETLSNLVAHGYNTANPQWSSSIMGIYNRMHGGGGGGMVGGAGDKTYVPAGSPVRSQGLATVTAANGRRFQVASEFAPNFQGFIKDYEAAGGVLGPYTGTLGTRGNASAHPAGAALDLNQTARGQRGGGRSLPPAIEDKLAEKWGLVSGNSWRDNDQGHFEVRSRAQAARALLDQQKVNVQGSGHIQVDVNAPSGTKVSGSGRGLFNSVNVRRDVQMPQADSGADQTTGAP